MRKPPPSLRTIRERDPGHVYHLFPVLLAVRAALQAHLASAGIDTMVHYPMALTKQPAFATFASHECPVAAAAAMVATIPEALLRVESPPMADWTEGFVSMKMHAYIRFGKWDEILAEPFPADPQLYCVTTAMQRYARAIACAITGRLDAAEAERRAFAEAVARVPETRYIFNNKCTDILAVAAEMLNGERNRTTATHTP